MMEEYTGIVSFLSELLNVITEHGWLSVIGALIIVLLVWHRKTFWPWFINVGGAAIKGQFYAERITQLESDLKQERIDCDDKIAKLEEKLEKMNEHIIELSSLVATLKERLEKKITSVKVPKESRNGEEN